MADEPYLPDVFGAGEEENASGGVFDGSPAPCCSDSGEVIGSDTLVAGNRQQRHGEAFNITAGLALYESLPLMQQGTAASGDA